MNDKVLSNSVSRLKFRIEKIPWFESFYPSVMGFFFSFTDQVEITVKIIRETDL